MMEKLTIATRINPQTAIRLGLAEIGDGAYPLTEVLPLLVEQTRAWLEQAWTRHTADGPGKIHGYSVSLDAAPSAESVARGIEAMCAEQEADAMSQAAEREATITQSLAAPDTDWIGEARNGDYLIEGGSHRRPCVDPDPRGVYLDDDARRDPRIVALRERLISAVLPALAADWDRRKAEYDRECERVAAEKAAENAARTASIAAAKASVCAWVIESGESIGLPLTILRAAREGRDVSRAVRDAIDTRVRDAIQALVPSVDSDAIGPATHSSEPDTRVPSARAYEIRDALVAGVDAIRKAAALPGAELAIGDFERYDVADVADGADAMRAVWRSGVDVQVRHAWYPDYDFGLRVLTEPVESDDSDD